MSHGVRWQYGVAVHKYQYISNLNLFLNLFLLFFKKDLHLFLGGAIIGFNGL